MGGVFIDKFNFLRTTWLLSFSLVSLFLSPLLVQSFQSQSTTTASDSPQSDSNFFHYNAHSSYDLQPVIHRAGLACGNEKMALRIQIIGAMAKYATVQLHSAIAIKIPFPSISCKPPTNYNDIERIAESESFACSESQVESQLFLT